MEREKQERERVIYRSKNTIKRGQYQGKQHDLNRERILTWPEHERGQKEKEEKEQEKIRIGTRGRLRNERKGRHNIGWKEKRSV